MSHIQTFQDNLKQIERLLEIHTELTGNERGRRDNVEVLNKSGVVLLVACWEAFVEDLADSSLDFLLDHTSDPNIFPKEVLVKASKQLREARDERLVWNLAGSGWQDVFRNYKSQLLTSFNTPSAQKIDTLYEDLIGIKKLSDNWFWQKMNKTTASKTLNDLISLRGNIAHRVNAKTPVYKLNLQKNSAFISRLAIISSNSLRKYIMKTLGGVGVSPWDEVTLP